MVQWKLQGFLGSVEVLLGPAEVCLDLLGSAKVCCSLRASAGVWKGLQGSVEVCISLQGFVLFVLSSLLKTAGVY